MRPEEEISKDDGGDGEGQDPKEKPCLGTARRCSNLLQWYLATQETWESRLHPTLAKISEFNCCQRVGIQ